jgi:hypothetical protein
MGTKGLRKLFISLLVALGKSVDILYLIVLYPEKGVCADPVDKGAILGERGGKPHSSDKERQLAPDIGRGKT